MAFRLDSFLISIIIFSFIIAVGSGWIVSMADHYEVDYDSKFGTVYQTVRNTENLTKEQKEMVIGGEIDDEDPLDRSIKGATSALNLMTGPIEIVTLIVHDVESEVPGGMPIDLEMYVKVAITIMVIFGLIYLFFRIRSW